MLTGPGLTDLREGLTMWRLWVRIGWMDVVRRYRRTMIGPFWNTLNVALFVAMTGFMYSSIFNQDAAHYLPYLASGFAAWVPISTFVNEAAGVFISADGVVKQIRIPLSTFVFAAIVRNALVFSHNITVFVAVAILFEVEVNANSLLAIPAIALLVLNAVWVGILVAMLCTRYRDLQPTVGSLLQIAFLMTPVFWLPSQAGGARRYLVDFNPLFHFVDILRAPLQGQAPDILSWQVTIGITLAGWLVTILIFNRRRDSVVFWL
jgi:lipopolysaccharide transport system permease protein